MKRKSKYQKQKYKESAQYKRLRAGQLYHYPTLDSLPSGSFNVDSYYRSNYPQNYPERVADIEWGPYALGAAQHVSEYLGGAYNAFTGAVSAIEGTVGAVEAITEIVATGGGSTSVSLPRALEGAWQAYGGIKRTIEGVSEFTNQENNKKMRGTTQVEEPSGTIGGTQGPITAQKWRIKAHWLKRSDRIMIAREPRLKYMGFSSWSHTAGRNRQGFAFLGAPYGASNTTSGTGALLNCFGTLASLTTNAAQFQATLPGGQVNTQSLSTPMQYCILGGKLIHTIRNVMTEPCYVEVSYLMPKKTWSGNDPYVASAGTTGPANSYQLYNAVATDTGQKVITQSTCSGSLAQSSTVKMSGANTPISGGYSTDGTSWYTRQSIQINPTDLERLIQAGYDKKFQGGGGATPNNSGFKSIDYLAPNCNPWYSDYLREWWKCVSKKLIIMGPNTVRNIIIDMDYKIPMNTKMWDKGEVQKGLSGTVMLRFWGCVKDGTGTASGFVAADANTGATNAATLAEALNATSTAEGVALIGAEDAKPTATNIGTYLCDCKIVGYTTYHMTYCSYPDEGGVNTFIMGNIGQHINNAYSATDIGVELSRGPPLIPTAGDNVLDSSVQGTLHMP